MKIWLAWLCAALGCAHLPPIAHPPAAVAVPDSLLSIEAETDREDIDGLAQIAAGALPAIQRWGGLRAPTRVVVVADHAALEKRAGRMGFGWLRAWARYDVVYLQSPRTWRFLISPSDREVRQILAHELTHCVMYQAITDANDWERVPVPLWFREGMASWTAQEADKRYPVDDLHRFATEHPELDPLRQAELMVRDDSPLVYSAAHWAFDGLASRGSERVNQLLAAMRAGRTFEQSFEEAFGETEDAFLDRTLSDWRKTAARAASAEPVIGKAPCACPSRFCRR